MAENPKKNKINAGAKNSNNKIKIPTAHHTTVGDACKKENKLIIIVKYSKEILNLGQADTPTYVLVTI